MKNKRKINAIISFLLVLFIVAVMYLTSFNLNAFNESFYSREFKKYNIYGKFPAEDIDKLNSGLLLYLKDKNDDFNKELFNQQEIGHLKDVKSVIQKINILYCIMLIILIILIALLFSLNRKGFLKNISVVLFFSGILALFAAVLLLILAKLNFDGVFTIFHNIFFPEGGWLFSASDNIIRLYPAEFFYDMAKRIFLSVVLYGNILILVGIFGFFYKNG